MFSYIFIQSYFVSNVQYNTAYNANRSEYKLNKIQYMIYENGMTWYFWFAIYVHKKGNYEVNHQLGQLYSAYNKKGLPFAYY